jgi:hypothetical protein
MNGIRRALLAIHSIALLAACGGLAALALNQDQMLDILVGDFNLQAFIAAGDAATAVFLLVLAAIALLGFLSLLAAVWRASPARSRGVYSLRQADGGIVEIPAATLEALLRDALQALPEVRRAEPRVNVRSGAVESHIDATIEPSVTIAIATKLIVDSVHAVLREQVGVTNVRRPAIRIMYDDAAARPAGVVAPPPAYGSSPPAPPPPPPDGPAAPPAPIFPAARGPASPPPAAGPEKQPDE